MVLALFICYGVGLALLLGGGLFWVAAMATLYLRERRAHPWGSERRRYPRAPCQFQVEGLALGARCEGDLSLGGARVVLPVRAKTRSLRLVALGPEDRPAVRLDARVLWVHAAGGAFVHHLAFDPGASVAGLESLLEAAPRLAIA